MRNLADLMRAADPALEPCRNQAAILDGHPVLMLSVLDRTVVIELEGHRVLVKFDRLDIPDPNLLRWQRKPPDGKALHVLRAAVRKRAAEPQ